MEWLFDSKDSVLQKKLAQKKSLKVGRSRPGVAKMSPGGGGRPTVAFSWQRKIKLE